MSSGLALLGLAIGSEVAATLGLKAAALGRPAFAIASVAGYAAAFFFLSRSLQVLPVGVAYALWAGLGTVGVALLGWALFGESPSRLGWLGVGLIGCGVVLLGATTRAH